MSWSAIIGQERLKELFKKTITKKRLAHSYLFSGSPGIGKSAFAIELAKVLQCERQSSDACEECSSCKKFRTLQHPNLYLIFALPVGKNEVAGDSPIEKLLPDDLAAIREQIQCKARNPYHAISVPKGNFIKVNSIREVRKNSAMKSFSTGMKVFLFLNADEMNEEASNALLKTLEEPHADSMLILTTSYPERLLPTIVSRCQHIRFDPLSEQQIAEALRTQRGIDEKRASRIARRANGNYSLALDILSKEEGNQQFSAADFLRTVVYKSRKEIIQMIDELASNNDRVSLEQCIMDVQTWLHDALRLQEGKQEMVNGEDEQALKDFVARYPNVDFPAVFRSLDTTISLLNKNVYIPLVLINLAIELRTSILSLNK